MRPKRIRFMVDDVTDIALWTEGAAADNFQDTLPITEDLRQRIKSWVSEYTEGIVGGGRPWTAERAAEHDRRGYEMSIELQRALGPSYHVEYVFQTDGSS
jgi:hypothetical protein